MPGGCKSDRLLGDTFGKESFGGASALIGVGLQVYSDWNDQNLTGAQKLGRASFAILDILPPVGLAHFATDMLFPGKWDRATSYAFSKSAPWNKFLGDMMYTHGGPGFQHWLMKQTWLDYF